MEDFVGLVRDIKIFHGLSDAQLQVIGPYLEEKNESRGTWIVEEGGHADGMFLICEGTVQVWKNSGGKKLGLCLGELTRGDCFGEMSLIDCQNRSATVVTTSDLTALHLPYSAMANIYEQDPKLYGLFLLNISREVCRRLRDTDRTLVEFSLPKFG